MEMSSLSRRWSRFTQRQEPRVPVNKGGRRLHALWWGLKHDLLAAPVVALHHAGPVVAVQVLPPGSGLRLGGSRRHRRGGPLRVRGHGHAHAQAEPLVAAGVAVQAARALAGVVAHGGVLVGALGAGQREPVGPQEVVQVLVAVAGRQRGAAVAAIQREREAAESRVPA